MATDSPFANHPNFDPEFDAAVGEWVRSTRRLDWTAMTEQEQALAYMDFLVAVHDDELPDLEKAFPKNY